MRWCRKSAIILWAFLRPCDRLAAIDVAPGLERPTMRAPILLADDHAFVFGDTLVTRKDKTKHNQLLEMAALVG